MVSIAKSLNAGSLLLLFLLLTQREAFAVPVDISNTGEVPSLPEMIDSLNQNPKNVFLLSEDIEGKKLRSVLEDNSRIISSLEVSLAKVLDQKK